MSEALDSIGNVVAQQFYIPNGGSRYYDPVLGQFASADTAQDGAG